MKKIRKYKENYILKPNKSGSVWFELLFLKNRWYSLEQNRCHPNFNMLDFVNSMNTKKKKPN